MQKLILQIVTIASILTVAGISIVNAQVVNNCAFFPLSTAQNFNVIVNNNIDMTNSDTEGRMAAGGDITLNNYSVGLKLTNSNGNRDDLISGKSINFNNGKVENGNAVYMDSANLSNVELPNGTTRQENVLDFSNIFSTLKINSINLKNYSSNGTVSQNAGELTLTGVNNDSNIFTLNYVQIASSSKIILNAPLNSTILINVSGTNVSIKNLGIVLQNINANHILWNFYEATNIDIENVAIFGSFLAPIADIKFNSGVMYGNMVSKSLIGGDQNTAAGQFNLLSFTGCVNNIGGDNTTTMTTPVPSTTVVPTKTPGAVLGASTGDPAVASLANTGDNATFSLILGSLIIGTLIAVNLASRRRIFVKIK